MSEYVIIEKSELAAIANKVREVSGSNAAMKVSDIKSNFGAGIDAVKETLTGYLEDNGKTFDQDLSLGQIANIVGTVEGEDLSAEISAQANLIANQNYKIAELAEILDGKASGGSGGNVETCEVRVNSPDMFIHYVDENQTLRLGYDDEIHKVAKNSLMICGLGEGTAVTLSGGITRQIMLTDGEDNFMIVYVSDDGAIDLEL